MAFVKDNTDVYAVTVMCAVLEISRSGYYAWLKREVSVREQADQACLREIEALRKLRG